MKFPSVASKTAIVTGCSSGIGLATAEMFRERGWRVIPTARKPEDLAMLTDRGFDPLELDIADPASTENAAVKICERFGDQIGALVNNAGFGQVGAMEDLSRAMLAYQFEVNVIGMQHLANLLLPAMRRQGCGRIINISSVLGRLSLPFLGVYSASKFAMEAMSDAMRVELRGSGIAVSIVEPGPITTAFGENAAARAIATLQAKSTPHRAHYEREIKRREITSLKKVPFALPPEAVARKILHAAESPHPRRRYCVTFPACAGALMARFAPAALLDVIMSRQVKVGT